MSHNKWYQKTDGQWREITPEGGGSSIPYTAYAEKIADLNADSYPEGAIALTDESDGSSGNGGSGDIPIATIEEAGKVKPDGNTIDIDAEGTISAKKASTDTLGIVKPDNKSINIDSNGVISVQPKRHIGEIFYSLLPIEDAGVHLCDGATINFTGMYEDFGAYLKNLYARAPEVPNVFYHGEIKDASGAGLTNFGSGNYATTPIYLSAGEYTNSWELVFNYTPYDVSVTQDIVRLGEGYTGFYLNLSNGSLQFGAGNNGSSWNVVTDFRGTTVLENYTEYKIKIEYDSTSGYSVSLWNAIESTWEEEIFSSNRDMLGVVTKPVLFGAVKGSPFQMPTDTIIALYNAYFSENGTVRWNGTRKAGFCPKIIHNKFIYDYGVCGLFGMDGQGDTSVWLPKIPGFVEGAITNAELGRVTEAGAPNITGTPGASIAATDWFTGAYQAQSQQTSYAAGTQGTVWTSTFDASRSNSIYGNSKTIQPQSVKGYVYIVLGNVVTSSVEVDAAKYVQDFETLDAKVNTKIGYSDIPKALAKTTDNTKRVSISIPSSSDIDTVIPISGLLYVGATSTSATGHIRLFVCRYAEGTTEAGVQWDTICWAPNGQAIRVCAPVQKGDIIRFIYGSISNGNAVITPYAEDIL